MAASIIEGYDYRTRKPLAMPRGEVRRLIRAARAAHLIRRGGADTLVMHRDATNSLRIAVEYYTRERSL